jgi:hypothetical protein
MAAFCSAFPFLTQSEFEGACQDLADRCTSAQHIDWSAIRLLTKVSLFFMHEPLNLIWFLMYVLNEELMGTYGLDETSQMEPASE